MKTLRQFLVLLTLAAVFQADTLYASELLSKANTLIKDGQTEEAYHLLFSALREDPDSDEINLALARAALASNHPHQAIMAYERLIKKYPGEVMFHREIASAYLSIEDRVTAEHYLRLDPKVNDETIEPVLKDIGKRYERFQKRWTLRAGALYDSNANQGLNSNTINLGDYMLTLSDSAEKVRSGGMYFGGNLDTSYKLSRVTPWHFVSDLAFYMRYGTSGELQDAGQEYSQWWRGAFGFRHVGEGNTLDFRIKGEVFDYDFYETVYSYGGEVTFSHAVSRRWYFITRASIDERNYVRNHPYDGSYGSVGQYSWWLFGKSDHEFTIGGRYVFANADYKDYGYDGWEASAWFRFKLQNGLELSPSLSYTEERYDGPATILETDNRRDKRLRIGLSAAKRLSEKLTLEMSYQYTDNDSNSEIHDYNRHLINVGWVWSF